MKKNNLDRFRDAYNENFKFYDEDVLMLSWYGQRMINAIQEKGFKSVMSLGIGHKVVGKKIISELGHILEKYIVIEGSSEIINELREELGLLTNVLIVESLFENYDAEEQVDAIEMGFVLEHVDDPEFLIRKYTQMLKPGGSLFIAVPNARSLHRLVGYESGLSDDMYSLGEFDVRLGHKRYFDLISISRLIMNLGLQIVNKEGIFLKPFSTSQLKSLELSSQVMQALCSIGVQYPEISNGIYIEATV